MIPVLLWRCPVCRTDDALRQTRGWWKPDRLWCAHCHVTWEVQRVFKGDYRLRVIGGDAAPHGEEAPLAEWYDRMQATLQLVPLHDPALDLEPGEFLWAQSKRVMVFREVPISRDAATVYVRTERLGRGRLFLTSERLIWRGSRGQEALRFKNVKAVWTLGGGILGVECEGSELYTIRFLEDSVLKWLSQVALVAKQFEATHGHRISQTRASTELVRSASPTARYFDRRRELLLAGLIRLSPAAWQLARWLYRLKISGREHIPDTGAFLFVASHPSRLDFLSVWALLRMRPDSILLLGVRLAVMVGAYRRAGVTAISAAGVAALRSALHEIQSGRPAIIAPEGGLQWDGRLRPLLPGAAVLAARSGTPVVVAVLRGGYSIWPRWAAFPKLTGRLELRIGQPFRFSPAAGRDIVEEANRRIADEMMRLEAEP